MGNIASVTQNGKTTAYTYDALGQLIRVDDENDPTSGTAGTTWTYEYDRGGNILEKKRYAYTTGTLGTALETVTYTYDTTWNEMLLLRRVRREAATADSFRKTGDVPTMRCIHRRFMHQYIFALRYILHNYRNSFFLVFPNGVRDLLRMIQIKASIRSLF